MTCPRHPESTHADCLDCMALDWSPYIEDDCENEDHPEKPGEVLVQPGDPILDVGQDGWWDDWQVYPARFHYGPLVPENVTMAVIHSGTTGSDEFGRYFANPIMRNKDGSLQWRRVATQGSTTHEREIVQHVKYTHGAPHCGRWNRTSIGIENPGPVDRKYPEWVGELTALWVERHLEIYPIHKVCSHRYLSPSRKRDPGPHFPWGPIEALAEKHGLKVFK